MANPILAGRNIAKSFGTVQVLEGVNFDVLAGEVHALVGENGAGKSTLMKALSGYHRPSAGQVLLDGEPVAFADSGGAEARGIILIHQEFSLAEHLTVEENVFLGRELRRGPFLDCAAMRDRSRRALADLNCDVDPMRRVLDLAVSEKQMVEIAKAVSRDVRVLIMDEPTAVLTGAETEILFRLIRRLKQQGVGIVYISHKLNEVKAISDRVTVLRDGRRIDTRPTAELSHDDIARLMVGRSISDMFLPTQPPADDAAIVFSVTGLTVPGWVADASFDLRRGEILGFAGLVGAGRTELIEGTLGLRHRTGGRIERDGRPLSVHSLDDAAAAGIAYLTEDRKGKGLLVDMRLRPNLTLLALRRYGTVFLDDRRERAALQRAAKDFDIRAASLEATVSALSGGNQQKLLLAKTMQVEPEILIVDEPTRGIDIGTKQQIYLFLHDFARRGGSVIVISSDLPEIIGLCHRAVVMHSGTITGVLAGNDINENEIVRHATGLATTRH